MRLEKTLAFACAVAVADHRNGRCAVNSKAIFAGVFALVVGGLCPSAFGQVSNSATGQGKPNSAKEEQKEPKLRTWTDSTGKFRVEAEFVELKDGKVQLRKQDGKVIDVPLERLSAADQEYIKSRREEGSKRAGARAAPATPTKEEKPDAQREGQGQKGERLAGAAWSLNNVTANPTESYTTTDGGEKVTIEPSKGLRFIRVDFELKAEIPEDNCIERLRTLIGGTVNRIRGDVMKSLASDEFRKLLGDLKELQGDYRCFSMSDLRLSDGKTLASKPRWIEGPRASLSAFRKIGGGKVTETISPYSGGGDGPWHCTVESNASFSGLLEVGKPAKISLIYQIPIETALDALQLRIENEVPVKVEVQE